MKRITFAFLALLLAIMVAGGGVSLQARTTLADSPDDVQVGINAPEYVAPGDNFTARVDITTVADFDAANYNVSFDATVLRLDDVTPGLIGSTTISIDIYNEITSGTYIIVQNVPGLSGVTGSGHLAVLHFQVIGSLDDSSDISLSNGTLANMMAEEIPATWTADSVSVISAEAGEGELPPTTPPSLQPGTTHAPGPIGNGSSGGSTQGNETPVSLPAS